LQSSALEHSYGKRYSEPHLYRKRRSLAGVGGSLKNKELPVTVRGFVRIASEKRLSD
jgi:hypothetical protein